MYVKKYIILMGKCIWKQVNEEYINALINETIDSLLNNGQSINKEIYLKIRKNIQKAYYSNYIKMKN